MRSAERADGRSPSRRTEARRASGRRTRCRGSMDRGRSRELAGTVATTTADPRRGVRTSAMRGGGGNRRSAHRTRGRSGREHEALRVGLTKRRGGDGLHDQSAPSQLVGRQRSKVRQAHLLEGRRPARAHRVDAGRAAKRRSDVERQEDIEAVGIEIGPYVCVWLGVDEATRRPTARRRWLRGRLDGRLLGRSAN